jgi:hypothetical protein
LALAVGCVSGFIGYLVVNMLQLFAFLYPRRRYSTALQSQILAYIIILLPCPGGFAVGEKPVTCEAPRRGRGAFFEKQEGVVIQSLASFPTATTFVHRREKLDATAIAAFVARGRDPVKPSAAARGGFRGFPQQLQKKKIARAAAAMSATYVSSL